jgi:hypothetical protein
MLRPAADADERAGSGRFGGIDRHHPTPRQELGVRQRGVSGLDLVDDPTLGPTSLDALGGAEHEHVGSVAQADQRHGLTRSCSFEIRGEQQCSLGSSGVADGVAERHCVGSTELLQERVDGAPVRAGHQHGIYRRCVEADVRERCGPRLLAERDELCLAEPLLPLLGAHVAGRPPAIEELASGRGPAEVFSHKRLGVARSGHDGGTGIAAGRLVRRVRETATDVGGHHEGRRVGRVQRVAQRRDPRPHRPARIDRQRRRIKPEGRVDNGRVRLLEVRRRRGGEPQGRRRVRRRRERESTCLDGERGGCLRRTTPRSGSRDRGRHGTPRLRRGRAASRAHSPRH